MYSRLLVTWLPQLFSQTLQVKPQLQVQDVSRMAVFRNLRNCGDLTSFGCHRQQEQTVPAFFGEPAVKTTASSAGITPFGCTGLGKCPSDSLRWVLRPHIILMSSSVGVESVQPFGHHLSASAFSRQPAIETAASSAGLTTPHLWCTALGRCQFPCLGAFGIPQVDDEAFDAPQAMLPGDVNLFAYPLHATAADSAERWDSDDAAANAEIKPFATNGTVFCSYSGNNSKPCSKFLKIRTKSANARPSALDATRS